MHTLWIFKRQTLSGPTYCVSQHEPVHLGNGQFQAPRGAIFIDVGLTIGILIAGRELRWGECIEVVISEVT
jgi:hypothetical protein